MTVATDVDESLYEGEAGPPVKTDGLHLRFYVRPVENKLLSWGGVRVKPDGSEEKVEGAGRPIFEDVEYVEIQTPGDKTNVVDRPVTPQDKRKWARQYAAFKAGDVEQLTGTPLTAWPGITRAQVEELRYFKIRTVEHLAEVSDGNLTNLGPIRALRQRAQDYLAAAKGAAPVASLRSELERRDVELAALRQQLKEQGEALASLSKQKSK